MPATNCLYAAVICEPEGILRATPHTMSLAKTCEEDSPLCVQLYGADPDRPNDSGVSARALAEKNRQRKLLGVLAVRP